MKTSLIAALVTLVATSEVVPPELLSPVARTGITGMLAFLVIWLVMKADRKTGEGLKALAKSVDRQTDAIITLREHCAVAREE